MRFAKARAKGRCEIPGCRNHIWLQCHHCKLRSEGGTHHVDNLLIVCQPHHDALHEGTIVLEGTRKTGLTFLHADGTPIGRQEANAERIDVFEKAYAELRADGISDEEARRKLEIVRKEHPNATLQEIVAFASTSGVRDGSHVGLFIGCIERGPRYGLVH
jgi:hypothetical protein